MSSPSSAQILFSGALFLFWLIYADGMSQSGREVSARRLHSLTCHTLSCAHSFAIMPILSLTALRVLPAPSPTQRYFCSFYLPKLLLVSTYVGVAAAMFVLHGRVRTASA